ncbi:hypothetical protein BC938DRAFT_476128 [Jimgerdemannia flammicorona]|uniref:Uncharacterized protein n=1 Tax=Jimgerdemannia flammicorona TaxID=994334 RepID=A0A433PK31_9FUNG|nr:hypothetical protein BC938DRAFT_476128 [Jimgerdemannia flammicorona]
MTANELVVRGSVGLIIQYAATKSNGHHDFVERTARQFNTTTGDAFLWDMCTSNHILQKVFTKYAAVRITLDATTYIRVTFRHTYAHTQPLTNIYLMGMLWLDQKIARWGMLTYGKYKEDNHGRLRSRNGLYLLKRTRNNINDLEKAIYKGIFAGNRSPFRIPFAANNNAHYYLRIPWSQSYLDCFASVKQLFELAGDACIRILNKLAARKPTDFDALMATFPGLGNDRDYEHWGNMKLFGLLSHVWPRFWRCAGQILLKEWSTEAPARHMVRYFEVLRTDSWRDPLQLAALAYNVCVLVTMAGANRLTRRLERIEDKIEENVALGTSFLPCIDVPP